jgi:hypothetical protein
MTLPTEDEAYRAGYEAGRDGTTDSNTLLANFALPALRDAWERGYWDAKEGRDSANFAESSKTAKNGAAP